MPVPYGISTGIVATLDPLIVQVTTLHVVTDQNPRLILQTELIPLERNVGLVERVVSRVKVGAGHKVFKFFNGERMGVEGFNGLRAEQLIVENKDPM
ncbi:hypothetical protein SLA2020_504210 [Shorea laevis]